MSKRGADEYITKEHGSTPNKQEDSKVKMATAAQMAKRKMAAPKSRLNRAPVTTSTAPSNPFSGSSFGTSQPQAQQTFGSIGNGITFGSSQSFPPGGSSATSNDFSFAIPGQSTSFTFGQPVANNPFANLNGGVTQDESKGSEDTMMESPQKKPAFSAGVFGSNQGASSGSAFGGFGGFGQSTPGQQQPVQQPAFSFGQSQSNGMTSNSSSSIFGKSQSPVKAQDFNTEKPVAFGQPATTQASDGGSSFSGGSFGKPSQQQPTTFAFGQSTSEAPKSLFSFGTNQSPPVSSEPPKTPSFVFGQPSVSTKPDASKAPNFQLGNSATAPGTSSLFGASTSTPTNIFGGFKSTQTSEVNNTSKEDSNLKTATPAKVDNDNDTTASTTTAEPKNPFAGLFAEAPKTSDPPQSNTLKPVFSFGTPVTSGTLSGTQSTSQPDSSESANQSPAKPFFGFGSAASSAAYPSKPLFGIAPATPTQTPSLFSPTKAPSSEIPTSASSKTDSVDDVASSQQSTSTPRPPTTGFNFGQIPADKSTALVEPQSKPSTTFQFGTPASTTVKSAPTSFTPIASQQPTPNTAMQSKGIEKSSVSADDDSSFSGVATPMSEMVSDKSQQPAPVTTAPNAAKTPALMDDPKRTIYSNPPARIPPYLNAEKYKSYDSNYRLHSLNREFQKRIATLNPVSEDFENIVRNYVAARESIGESIGLYTRNIAGMKRKGDQLDDNIEARSTAKKLRQDQDANAQETPLKGQANSNIFQAVPSISKSTSLFNTNAMIANAAPSPSKSSASTLFKSMIPENSANKSVAQETGSNPFANLAAPASSSKQSLKTASGHDLFKSSTTTPPSSPPKSSGFKPGGFKPGGFKPSGFQMPSSTSSAGTSFLDVFKKQSEANAKKLERETMAKRKADDFDSDEDDEEAWNKQYQEELRAKRSKIGSIALTGFTPSVGSAASSVSGNEQQGSSADTPQSPVNISSDEESDSGEEAADKQHVDDAPEDLANDEDVDEDEDEDDDDDDEDDGDDTTKNQNTNGKSLFDRISRGTGNDAEKTPQPSEASSIPKSSSIFQSFKATPEAPSFSPITPSSSTPYKPAATFSFTPIPRDSPTPTTGASVFDGGITKDGPIPGEGLFGSRSSTPVNGEKATSNIFGGLGMSQTSTTDDHTWKKGSGIRFGTEAPSVNILAPSPVKEAPKFGTLFGTGTGTKPNSATSNLLGFGFGSSTSSPAPGFLSAASHLAPTSGTTSGISSRATSPGATDNESVATNETEDQQADPQASLLAHTGPYPGEEDEDILFEARAKVHRNYKENEIGGTKKTKGWNVEGIGPMRVLKNKESGKTRIVARAEPNAHVVLNANLTPGVTYSASGPNIVVPIFGSGGVTQWMIKVKTPAIASELSSILEDNKGQQ